MVVIDPFARQPQRQTCGHSWGRSEWDTERLALKHTHHHTSSRHPVGICCAMRAAQTGTLVQPRGWEVRVRFKREGTHVSLWLIHVDVWQKPTHHCKAIILQLKINIFF